MMEETQNLQNAAPNPVGQALKSGREAAGLTATNEIYPGAPHGYTMSDTSAWNEAAYRRAFTELRALFARTLG